jgi:hypothetical protein
MPPGIYVGTDDGLHVFGSQPRLELPGRRLRTLAADDDKIWALVGESEIFNAGAAAIWRHVTRLRNVRTTSIHPSGGGLLIGTYGARLYRLRGQQLEPVDSFDLVDGRAKWHAAPGEEPSVSSIGVDDDGTTFVNVRIGGVPRSTDDCATWEPTLDIDEDVHQIIALPGDGPLLAATARGLLTSWDHATTWNHRALGLDGTYCTAVGVCNDTVVMSASEGTNGKGAAIYRGGLEGVRLERCSRGLPDLETNIEPHCLAGAGSTVVFGTTTGAVYASADAGRSWELLADGLPPVRCVLVREERRNVW